MSNRSLYAISCANTPLLQLIRWRHLRCGKKTSDVFYETCTGTVYRRKPDKLAKERIPRILGVFAPTANREALIWRSAK